jgi:hypothetical protein
MTWFASESCTLPAYPLFFAKGPHGESQDDGVNGNRHTAVFTDFHTLCKLVGPAGALQGYDVITRVHSRNGD